MLHSAYERGELHIVDPKFSFDCKINIPIAEPFIKISQRTERAFGQVECAHLEPQRCSMQN